MPTTFCSWGSSGGSRAQASSGRSRGSGQRAGMRRSRRQMQVSSSSSSNQPVPAVLTTQTSALPLTQQSCVNACRPWCEWQLPHPSSFCTTGEQGVGYNWNGGQLAVQDCAAAVGRSCSTAIWLAGVELAPGHALPCLRLTFLALSCLPQLAHLGLPWLAWPGGCVCLLLGSRAGAEVRAHLPPTTASTDRSCCN